MKKIIQLVVLTTFSLSFMMSAHASTSVDLKGSTFVWKASKKLGDSHDGNIYLKSAKAEVNKKGQITGGEFVMDMTSFTVKGLDAKWEKKFLGHVKSGDFFEVSKYPTAKLVVEGQKGSAINGKLTIKEKTHPVTVDFKKAGNNYTGTFKFDRTKYGVTYGSENFFKLAADKVINNEVTVNFKVAVIKPAAKSTKKQ